MHIQPVVFKNFYTMSARPAHTESQEPCDMVRYFAKNFVLPDTQVNHALFDEQLAQKISSYKEQAVTPVTDMLKNTDDEKEITAGLFLLNRIIDAGAKNVGDTYPVISRFNYSKSHNVQVMLAGIYRKTLVPDAFGPLMTMFIKNSQNPVQIPFDPNEEVGGAILEYLRNNASTQCYETLKQKNVLKQFIY